MDIGAAALCHETRPHLPIPRWGRTHDAPKMPSELSLIVKTDERCQLGRPHASTKQFLRPCNAKTSQIRVGRHPDLRTESAAKVELVELRMHREILERDRMSQPLPQVCHRTPYRTRVTESSSTDARKRIDRFRKRNLERQPIRVRAHRVVQAVKRCRAFVVRVELCGHHPLTLPAYPRDLVRRQHHGRPRRRSLSQEVSMHVAGLFDLNAAGSAPPNLSAPPPLRAAMLDASDGVVLLHAGIQHRGRATRGA